MPFPNHSDGPRPNVPRTVRAGLVAMGIHPDELAIRRILITTSLIEIDSGIGETRASTTIIVLPPEG